MSQLAVFDIDGTLTDTHAVDEECFLRAVSDTLDIDASGIDWSAAPHITDSALLVWIAERHGHGTLTKRAVNAVLGRFLELLRAEREGYPARFRPIPGADRLFTALAGAGWACALATGGWERSARLKLNAAGLGGSALPLASSSDASTRVEILQVAVARARGDHAAFGRIVSVGDALWDIRAATELHWPFIGVAAGSAARTLRTHGATTVLPDFTDLAAVLTALAEAEPPRLDSVAPVT
jgi:phosphoglycolate phosphatase-like HAD superfamily hydrolase